MVYILDDSCTTYFDTSTLCPVSEALLTIPVSLFTLVAIRFSIYCIAGSDLTILASHSEN